MATLQKIPPLIDRFAMDDKLNMLADGVNNLVDGFGPYLDKAIDAAQDAEQAAEDATNAAKNVQTAIDGANAAAQAANDAASSATSAAGAANTAAEAATGAAGSASSAANSANEAAQAANTAAEAANEAASNAQKATNKATAAASIANSAAGSANVAATSATNAASVANTAAEVANSAAESATNAASAANEAASGANSAKDAANEAASSATSAAEAANAAAQAANDAASSADEAVAGIDGKVQEAVNERVLAKRYGPASMISASGVCENVPVAGMKVYGKTQRNLWVNPSGTQNGVTCTSNADGSLTLAGTSTGPCYFYLTTYALKPGATYTLTLDKTIAASMSVQSYGDSGYIADSVFVAAGSTSASGTVSQDATKFRLMVQLNAGTTIDNATVRVMLNEGSEAEPWCPPGLSSVSELGVVSAGKNLLKINSDLQTKTVNGVTFTPNEDGTVTVNGTSTGNSDYYLLGTSWANRADNYLPGQEMVFSSNARAKLYGFDSSGFTCFYAVLNGGNQIISAEQIIKAEKIVCYLSYASGQGETNKKVYAQLELGSTATAYEPPAVTTTPRRPRRPPAPQPAGRDARRAAHRRHGRGDAGAEGGYGGADEGERMGMG